MKYPTHCANCKAELEEMDHPVINDICFLCRVGKALEKGFNELTGTGASR